MVLRRLVSALALVGLASASLAQEAPQPPPQPLPRADPAAMGFSPERLARIGTVLDREVAEGRMPGAVLIIAREGRVVFHEAYGFRDKAAGAPMPRDALFNIASMTKPMTAVAVLGLAERGDLVLDDPVSAYLPGRFADQRVASLDLAGKLAGTVPAARPVSLRDLLTHTSGLVYGGRGTTE
ncbi:serine hydrolase domain-containing protein, partial [Methylobacterium sp. CCH5-D2]